MLSIISGYYRGGDQLMLGLLDAACVEIKSFTLRFNACAGNYGKTI